MLKGVKLRPLQKKNEIKLTNVARASLEELLCDYEDFLRQNKLIFWKIDDPRRKEFIRNYFQTADEVARWVKLHHENTKSPIPEIACNVILTLISISCMLLKRQIDSQCKAFQENGGFTEKLYHSRKSNKN